MEQQMHEEIHIDIKEEDAEEEEDRQPQAHHKTPQQQETLPTTETTTTTTATATTSSKDETIINIPITTTIRKNTWSSLSPILTAYDTDSSTSSRTSRVSSISSKSTVSSTCCTRHGEQIYMERGLVNVVGVSSNSAALDTDADADDDASAVHYKAEHRKSWPIFILAISLIEIAIFVYDFIQMQVPKETSPSAAIPLTIPTDSVLIYRPDRRLEMWRFVSYMFLHANLFHLGFNVVVQLFYGIPLEVMHGSARIAIIYFAGVFAGSLGTSVVDSEVYLVGASGGVYALLAAHLANITLNYAQMKYAVAQLLSVLIFVTCDLGYAFYTQFLYVDTDEQHLLNTGADKHHRYHHNAHTHVHQHSGISSTDNNLKGSLTSDFLDVERSTPPVSYIAHLTGALAGLTIGLLVLKNFERRAYKNLIWWLALGIYSAFTVFAIAFNLINTMTAQLMEEQGEVITQHLLHDLGVS